MFSLSALLMHALAQEHRRRNIENVALPCPGERNLEKKFKDWLTKCHATLDKSISFAAIAPASVQVRYKIE